MFAGILPVHGFGARVGSGGGAARWTSVPPGSGAGGGADGWRPVGVGAGHWGWGREGQVANGNWAWGKPGQM
jgi:hypothetical protein